MGNYKDGAWDEGTLSDNPNVTLSEAACVLQYAQCCFEGLKAYSTSDGRVVSFRADLNAQRMEDSCRRMEMPVFPQERFLDAVRQTVHANRKWVPPFGSGASLYLRPAEYDWLMALVCSLIIAAVTLCICLGGLVLGRRFGTRLAGRAQILGGAILIFIGLEIFISSFLS